MGVLRAGEPLAEFEWERTTRSCRITVPGAGMWRAAVAGRFIWRIEIRRIDADEPSLRFAGTSFRGMAELLDGRRFRFVNWVRWNLRPRLEFTEADGAPVLWFESLVGWKKFGTAVRTSDAPDHEGAHWPLLMLFGTLMLLWVRSGIVWLTGPWIPTTIHRRALTHWQQTALSSPTHPALPIDSSAE